MDAGRLDHQHILEGFTMNNLSDEGTVDL